MESSRVAEEIGPDEDQLLRKCRIEKVIDDDCHMVPISGVFSVKRTDPFVRTFLNDLPNLIEQNETCGLIWDEKLKPDNFKYEEGVHFLSTREVDKRTYNSTVSFYRDGVTGTKFAIKTLHKSTPFLKKEVEVGLNIQHQNVCSAFGIIVSKGMIHILLEYAGTSLYEERAWIAECPKRLQSFAKQSFEALDVLHRQGYVHCDIKPDNIMITRHEFGEFTVKLIDFGACHLQGSVLSRTAHTTTLYWPPEIWQAIEKKDVALCMPAMDVYALALTLYFVHTSNHLMQRFENKDLKKLMINTPNDILIIALPETLPSDLSVLMKSCLVGQHEDRSSVEGALNRLSDHTSLRRSLSNSAGEVNYKDSLNKMIISISKKMRHATPDTINLVNIVPQSSFQNSQEKPIAPKTKKIGCLSNNKVNKLSQKFKKRTPSQMKLNTQKVTQMAPETLHKSFVISDYDLEKESEPRLDNKEFSCSNLLKTVALHVKSSNQIKTFTAQSKNLVNAGVMQAVSDQNTAGFILKYPSKSISNMVTDDDSNIESGNKCKFKGKGTSRIVDNDRKNQQTEKEKKRNDGSKVAKNHAQHKSVCAKNENEKKETENICDEMEFVLRAFDDNVFTGANDDIVDSLYAMVMKEEQCDLARSFDIDIDTQKGRTNGQGKIASKTEEEPMDSESAEDAVNSRANNVDTSKHSSMSGIRKRVSELSTNASSIPGKALLNPPSHQCMKTHQLPNFDKILSENC